MIPLLALLIRARWTALAIVAVLGAGLGALAAAGADYPQRTADRLAADAVADAPLEQRSFRLAADSGEATMFETQIAELRKVPGLTTVYGQALPVMGFTTSTSSMLMFREDFCAHLRMTAGRCPAGPGEVAVPADQARTLQIGLGAVLDVAEAIYDEKLGWIPSGEGSQPFDVVGVYVPVDQHEDYWGSPSPFDTRLDGTVIGPLLAPADAIRTIPHKTHLITADVLVSPEVIAGSTWEAFREDVLLPRLVSGLDDGLPDLMEKIQADREYLRVTTPAVVVPVLALGCLVLFLLVSRRIQRERGELGVQSVRGLPMPLRWWLGAGAPALAVLTGITIGASATGTPLSGLVGLTALAALSAIAFAVLPVVAARPVDALRQVGPAWAARLRRLPAGEVALVVLAVTSLAFLRTGEGEGWGSFAPALIAAGTVVVLARLLPAVLRAAAPRAIRAGRLVTGLAAAQLGRRPTARHLIALTGLAVALLALVAAAADTAQAVREQQVALSVGADRVLSVRASEPAQVLAAVRDADPGGDFAMAVGRIQGDAAHPPILALDLSRPQLLDWDQATSAAALLARPSTPREPLRGTVELTVSASRTQPIGTTTPVISLVVTSPDGLRRSVTLGSPMAGRTTLRATLPPECDGGCRLDAIVGRGQPQSGWLLRVEQLAPYSDVDSWQVYGASETAGGWRVGGREGRRESWLLPPEAPRTLAVISTPEQDVDARGMSLPAPDGSSDGLRLNEAGELPVLPRLGGRGLLIDLNSLVSASAGGLALDTMEIWLTPRAPADFAAKLTRSGLLVVGDESRAQARSRAERTPQALTLRLHMAATAVAWLLLGTVLLVVANLDRGSADLDALRLAGLRDRTLRRASRSAYGVAVLLGVLLGLAAAALAWLLARGALPMGAAGSWITPPALPSALPVVLPVGFAALALVALAWLAFVPRRPSVPR
jgi:putative ABC transport system permease protein